MSQPKSVVVAYNMIAFAVADKKTFLAVAAENNFQRFPMDGGNELVAVVAKAVPATEEVMERCVAAAADPDDASSEMNDPMVPWADSGH